MTDWKEKLSDRPTDSRWTLYAKARLRMALGLKTKVVESDADEGWQQFGLIEVVE